MLLLERLEDRLCPSSIDITYNGGPTIPHAQVADLHADTTLTAYTDQAMRVIVSQYLPLLAPYGIGAGTLNGSSNVTPIPNVIVTNGQIQSSIAAEIQAGRTPAPGASQLYVYFLAPNQIVAEFPGASGYHWSFNLNGKAVYYAVVYGTSLGILQSYLSIAAAHEVAESVTDPQPGTGWFDLNSGLEVADVYQWQFLFALAGYQFSALSGPQGQILQGISILPPQPVQPVPSSPVAQLDELYSIAIDQFEALTFRVLAIIDPRDFVGRAAAEQTQLATHPLLHTPLGLVASTLGWVAFGEVVGSL